MADHFPPQHGGQSGQSSHGGQQAAERVTRLTNELNRVHSMGHLLN
jgi:hypothetical protein